MIGSDYAPEMQDPGDGDMFGAIADAAAAATRAAADGPRPVLDILAEIPAKRTELDAHTRDLVATAREADKSWAAIGAALGMSRQAAHERFG